MDTKSDLESAVDFINAEMQKEGIKSNTDEDSEETAIKKLTEEYDESDNPSSGWRAPDGAEGEAVGPELDDELTNVSRRVSKYRKQNPQHDLEDLQNEVRAWLQGASDPELEELFDLFVGEDPSNKLGMLEDILYAGRDRVEMLYDTIQEYEGMDDDDMFEGKKSTKDSK